MLPSSTFIRRGTAFCFLIIMIFQVTPITSSETDDDEVYLTGFTILPAEIRKKTFFDKRGRLNALENTKMLVQLFGKFTNKTYLRFTRTLRCDRAASSNEVKLQILPGSRYTASVANLTLPSFVEEPSYVYLCLFEANNHEGMLQGKTVNDEGKETVHPWLTIKLMTSVLPLWIHLLLIAFLLLLSALFSGLNLGLLSLDKTDLKVIINTGSQKERSEALQIVPVRNHGNYLLCCLVFSNVLVNTTLTLLMDQIFSGDGETVAVTTLSIVIIGEILPQAICSRHGLAVGAKTIWITKFFMFISFPVAYPVGKLLDMMLGEELGAVYTRDRLKELLKATQDQHGLETEEMGIIAGALEMKSKTVQDIMTPLDKMYMISIHSVLDYDLLSDIEYRGFTRIPIFDGARSNVVAILNVKQLTLVDPEKKIPVSTLTDYYKSSPFFVFQNERLDVMFRAFKEGNRGHMAFVQQISEDGPGDPFYETIGVVTMEDVLEELLQQEIYDENDVGRSKGTAEAQHLKLPPYQYKKTRAVVNVPPQLALAATQFLVTAVEPFKDNNVSHNIVQRLIGMNVHFVKIPTQIVYLRPRESTVFLFEAGKPSEHFVMLLEGKVWVQVGKEKLVYEAGAFTTFGVDLLLSYKKEAAGGKVNPSAHRSIADSGKKHTHNPDYTVRALTDLYILKLTYNSYVHARLATELENIYSDPEKAAERPDWATDIAKILDSDGPES